MLFFWKRIKAVSFILLLPVVLFSQIRDTAAKKIIYQGYISFIGEKKPNIVGTLICNGSRSFFYVKNMDSYTPVNNDSIITITTKKKANFIYKNHSNNQLVFEGTSMAFSKKQGGFYEDSLMGMNWNLQNEKKIVGKFECNKANCFWRGRAYTAWYTTSIALPEGPWKFGGLPGLIVEIADSTNSIFWTFASIENTKEKVPATPKILGNFSLFKKKFMEHHKKIVKAMSADDAPSDPSCASCSSSLTFTVNTVENLAD